MRFKKTIAAVVAAATLTVGMGSLSASAEPWSASHVNVPGVPYSESTVDTVTIYQKAKGANAICNYNTHTNVNATDGTTIIRCVTHSMTEQRIPNLNSEICEPDVGNPLVEIAVTYQIAASTPTSNDVFWSKGNIIKID